MARRKNKKKEESLKKEVQHLQQKISSMPATTTYSTSVSVALNEAAQKVFRSLPEELEMQDAGPIVEMVERYMDEKYSLPNPGTVHTPDKDYYLPALKLLHRYDDGVILSPGYTAVWKDGELEAECFAASIYQTITLREMIEDQQPSHVAPNEDCTCGIYGTVNLEEISEYISQYDYLLPGHQSRRYEYGTHLRQIGQLTYTNYYAELKLLEENSRESILCIVEPSPGTDVIVARKGWRAGRAFISEIIGETISLNDASHLLSIAWGRSVDLTAIIPEMEITDEDW